MPIAFVHGVPETSAIWGALVEELESRGIGFVVALYPDEYQVDSSLQRRLFETFDLRPEDYDLDFPNRLARTYLESLGVPVIDMLEPFRDRGRAESLYLPRNTHWNEAGRRLAGQLLFDAVSPLLPKALQEGAPADP